MVVRLVIIYFRRHVFICAYLRTAAGLLYSFGDAEITQLVISVLGYKDILGLNITMDNSIFFTKNQRIAYILCYLDGLLVIWLFA